MSVFYLVINGTTMIIEKKNDLSGAPTNGRRVVFRLVEKCFAERERERKKITQKRTP